MRALRVGASRDSAERVSLIVPGRDESAASTHWLFGQMDSLNDASDGYLRQLHTD